MNQADILKLAQEAGFHTGGAVIFYDSKVMNYLPSAELTKFAELVAQHERDAAYKREQEIVRLACLAAADQAREHQREIEAIRARIKP